MNSNNSLLGQGVTEQVEYTLPRSIVKISAYAEFLTKIKNMKNLLKT